MGNDGTNLVATSNNNDLFLVVDNNMIFQF